MNEVTININAIDSEVKAECHGCGSITKSFVEVRARDLYHVVICSRCIAYIHKELRLVPGALPLGSSDR